MPMKTLLHTKLTSSVLCRATTVGSEGRVSWNLGITANQFGKRKNNRCDSAVGYLPTLAKVIGHGDILSTQNNRELVEEARQRGGRPSRGETTVSVRPRVY